MAVISMGTTDTTVTVTWFDAPDQPDESQQTWRYPLLF
jgi:hypothetical protein